VRSAIPAQDEWLLVELCRENGQTRRSLVEGGLTEDEAKSTACEFNQNLSLFGITGHWCEAIRAGS
jgi:hypothetical protein